MMKEYDTRIQNKYKTNKLSEQNYNSMAWYERTYIIMPC